VAESGDLAQSHSAEFFDGTSALSTKVQVRADIDRVTIIDPAGVARDVHWPLIDTRWIDGAENPVLSTSATPDARLVLDSPALVDDLTTLGLLSKGVVETAKSRKTHSQAWKYGLAAVGVTVGLLIAIPLLSGPFARLAPDSWREKLGLESAKVIEALLGKQCENADAQAILERMTARLTKNLPATEMLNVAVLDTKMINAFAMAGGQIRMMDGLIRHAQSSEEVAGVLAHEIAHVILRHPEEFAFRQFGYEILLSTIADSGMVTEIAASTGMLLVNSAHSRDSEAAADALGIELLRSAGISSDGIADFFARHASDLGKLENVLKFVSSHPPSAARKEMFEKAGNTGGPALSNEDWQTLKLACSNS
jgi:Zn-dependent protease with chaperone function